MGLIKHLGLVLLIALPLLSKVSLANEDKKQFGKVLSLFEQTRYLEALAALEEIPTNSNLKGAIYYYDGLIRNRLEEYELAAKSLEKARQNSFKSQDLEYELGQAYYAMNEINLAIKFFLIAAKKGFKADSSLYYVAYSYQLLEEYKEAKKAYVQVLHMKDISDQLRQTCTYQLGEVLYALTEGKKDPKRLTITYVIPKLEEAYAIDNDSPVAPDIEKRLTELKRKYDLDPNVMKNGRVLSKKRWSVSLGQKMTYDNNVTLSNGLPSVQASQKDSFIFDSTASGNYKAALARRLTITPSLALTWKKHSDQDSSAVYYNDAYSITPTVQNTIEHKIGSKMASFLFDYEYGYTAQDPYKRHEMVMFSRTNQWTIGEKFTLFGSYESSFKFKYKELTSYSSLLDTKTTTFAFDHTFGFKNSQTLMVMIQLDYIRFETNKTLDLDSRLFLASYTYPEILPKFSFSLSMYLTFLEPVYQKNTRGTEISYNPTAKVTRTINDKMSISMSYSYTKKTSDLKAVYAYTKQATALEFNYSF